MNEIIIRHAKADDYQEIEKIMKQVHALHVGWRPDVYRHTDTVLDDDMFQNALKDNALLVAEADGHVAGMLLYMIRHTEGPGRVTKNSLFVDSIAVEESYRGQGIGHKLLDFTKTIRESQNLDGIELQVNARNLAALHMYQSYGFTEKSINLELH